MEHFEMVEKLRQKANVSYEEAKAALEQNDWDLLDALVSLEGQGRVHGEQAESFTTKKEARKEPAKEPDFRSAFTRFFQFLGELVNKGNKIQLEISRYGKPVIALPLTVVVVLAVFLFWVVLWMAVIGFFFGFRYTFSGHKGAEAVNKAMDKAAQVTEQIKQGVKDGDKENSPEA